MSTFIELTDLSCIRAIYGLRGDMSMEFGEERRLI